MSSLRKQYPLEWHSFCAAQMRCNYPPEHPQFKDYAGRGIKFLFQNFEQFMKELGPKLSPKLTIERINNDGNYEPGNVRWATRSEQNLNTRRTHESYVKCGGLKIMDEDGLRRHREGARRGGLASSKVIKNYSPQGIQRKREGGQKAREKLSPEQVSLGGKIGTHVRWHLNRGIKNPDCNFCQEVA